MDLNKARKIELSDKDFFDTYFGKYPPQISEFTFTNLFAWQNYYNNIFIEAENHLLIFSKTFLKKWKKPKTNSDEVLFFLPPIGDMPHEIMLSLFEQMDIVEFHRVPENIISDLKDKANLDDLGIKIEEDRDNWDYVYDKQALEDLSGNKYRSKRRFLESFLEEYDYEFHLLSGEWIETCRKLQNKWCIINECQSNEDLEQEQKAIDRLIDNYAELGYNGGVLLVEDDPVAYTFGEMLNENTTVIHIEKAHRHYNGSYQAINHMFLENCCGEGTEYINREQDLGVPGLRKAKQSYHPDHMVKKYIVYKEES
ncbi:MAG: DUF2156 domain-containing protein [Promethearchaeota archaeon]|nr:MAG: DUF2156 domain-containing protein [Candidatus Lokiarchaeota archaeon]